MTWARSPMETVVRREKGRITLAARGDARSVLTEDTAGPFAAASGDALTATDAAHIAPTHYRDWLATSCPSRPSSPTARTEN